jgi:hypothetical protein
MTICVADYTSFRISAFTGCVRTGLCIGHDCLELPALEQYVRHAQWQG